MLLKRVHDAAGNVIGVQLKHTGIDPAQNFSAELVMQAVSAGWMSINGDTLTLHAQPEDLHYTILRRPGYYCCHDGKRIPISDLAMQESMTQQAARLAAAEARGYLAAHGFAGQPSPDPQNPSGYARINAFECTLDPAQHSKYKAVQGALAMSLNPGA